MRRKKKGRKQTKGIKKSMTTKKKTKGKKKNTKGRKKQQLNKKGTFVPYTLSVHFIYI